MKKYDVSYEYTTFFVLQLLLKVGKNVKISIDNSFEVRKILLDSFYDVGMQNSILDKNKTVHKFLNDYKAYVYLENGNICLKDDIDFKDINILLKSIDCNIILDYSLNLFKYLQINEPIDFINRLNKMEKIIEKLYYLKDTKKIKHYLDARFDIYNNFSLENEDIIDIISDLQSQDRMNIEDDYVVYPVNKTNYENSSLSDTQYRIEDMLNSPIQKAIFSTNPLFSSKIRFDIDTNIDDMEELENEKYQELKKEDYDIDYESEYDSEDCDDTIDYDNIQTEYDSDSNELLARAIFENVGYENLSRKDIIFALQYIDVINNYTKYYGKLDRLDLISKRLKYIIDNKIMNITTKDDNGIKKLLNDYLENDDQVFDEFEEESAYFLLELIKDEADSYFLPKLLFVKAYYNLTYDNELFNLFSKYENIDRYKLLHNFIISDNPNVSLENSKSIGPKMLVLK